MQVPAPVADPRGCDHAPGQSGLGRQKGEQARGRLGRALADDDAQVPVHLLTHAQSALDHRAGAVDHVETPVVLPQGQRLTLEQTDVHSIGQHARDACLLDPAKPLQPLLGRGGVESEQRHADLNAELAAQCFGRRPPAPFHEHVAHHQSGLPRPGHELLIRAIPGVADAAGHDPAGRPEGDAESQ